MKRLSLNVTVESNDGSLYVPTPQRKVRERIENTSIIPSNICFMDLKLLNKFIKQVNQICDRVWENPAYSEFYDFLVSYIFDKLYHRANPRSSFRATVRFVVEIQHFVCDRATPPTIEKLRSKGVAMHAYGVSAYYA